jgi:hypothetical protein
MMWLLLGLFLTIALADPESTCSTAVSPGILTYTVGSTSTTGYLIQAGGTGSGKWGTVTPAASQVTIGLGPRFYLANSCATAFSASVFSGVKVLGGSITFTADLSQVGCGLNAAFYLVSMPAASAGSNGDYYCDANAVGGTACSEMDLFEANRHAIQITPHRCSGGSCDGGGCAKNTQSISNGFGPASTYTINSLNPFTVKVSFTSSSGTLTGITSVISQTTSGTTKSITLTHGSECGTNYLSDMGTALAAGMVPVWSFWSGDVSWLDSPACPNENNEVKGNFIFSNLIVSGTTGAISPPPPPPPPPPGSLVCGTSGTTTNYYWVEFKAPSGTDVNNAPAGAVKCNNGQSFSCTYSTANVKYQCSCGSGCPTPFTVTVGGKNCVLSSSAAISDSTAETTFGSDQPLIIGLSVGIAVTILVILVLIVVFFIRKQTGTYIENV